MDGDVRFANSPGKYMAHPTTLVHPSFLVASLVALLAGTLSIACSSTSTTVAQINNSDAGSIGGSANGGNSNSKGGTASSAGGTNSSAGGTTGTSTAANCVKLGSTGCTSSCC